MKTHDPKRKCFGEVGINDLTRSLSKYLEDVKTNMSGNIVNQADQIVSLDFGYDASRGLDTGKCIIVNNEPQFTDVKSLVDKIRANKQRGSRI
jgi:phosphotransferase system IIA component